MKYIVVTGAEGFIGSCLASRLNREGYRHLMLVDGFSSETKQANLAGKSFAGQVHRNDFFRWLEKYHPEVSFIFHLGARTDTAENDVAVFNRLNLQYSKNIWKACAAYHVPLIYASSAATYGAGEHGYDDSHNTLDQLKPLNPYSKSKHDFDRWVLRQQTNPPYWAGLKFFNVYGPNEYHKGRMASAILHMFRQTQEHGVISLFRSHRKDIADGEQKRDFVYVKDVVDVCLYLFKNQSLPGIYNIGTGQARTFREVATSVFKAVGKELNIQYIDTPASIRNNYQYYTKASVHKLRKAGYVKEFTGLEAGIEDYISNYLSSGKYY